VSKVGIIGAGQLGQMLGFAGRAIDAECTFLDPSPAPPALDAGEVLTFAFDDPAGLAELADRSDVLTYEFENVPVDAVVALGHRITVRPPPVALRAAQDRLDEKQLFHTLDIPTPRFHDVGSRSALDDAASSLDYPFVLKTRRLGYDGKGQAAVSDASELDAVWQRLGTVPLIAEQWIAFDREVSAIGARDAAGAIATYPLSQNVHEGGILRTTIAPATGDALAAQATTYHTRLLEHLDYVGVLALELFVVGDRLLANEFAPRVHNSGHWTIEGAVTSQFENHLRAITGLPLGDASSRGHAAMVNLIGAMPAALDEIRAAGFFVHDYGKAPRPRRKLGHISLLAASAEERDRRLKELERLLSRR